MGASTKENWVISSCMKISNSKHHIMQSIILLCLVWHGLHTTIKYKSECCACVCKLVGAHSTSHCSNDYIFDCWFCTFSLSLSPFVHHFLSFFGCAVRTSVYIGHRFPLFYSHFVVLFCLVFLLMQSMHIENLVSKHMTFLVRSSVRLFVGWFAGGPLALCVDK